MNQRILGRVLGLIAEGAEIKELRSMGLIVIKTGAKRTRRSQAEMIRDKKKDPTNK
jgi:hypothetical protein